MFTLNAMLQDISEEIQEIKTEETNEKLKHEQEAD
jgi:hypothetical protein